jgi:ssDNA-binding Zn-finger/Zn-ribbon topoisomerase 1
MLQNVLSNGSAGEDRQKGNISEGRANSPERSSPQKGSFEEEGSTIMAPYRDLQLLWGGLMAGRSVENRYCPNCRMTTKFRRAGDLKCLRCGKRLQIRRRERA